MRPRSRPWLPTGLRCTIRFLAVIFGQSQSHNVGNRRQIRCDEGYLRLRAPSLLCCPAPFRSRVEPATNGFRLGSGLLRTVSGLLRTVVPFPRYVPFLHWTEGCSVDCIHPFCTWLIWRQLSPVLSRGVLRSRSASRRRRVSSRAPLRLPLTLPFWRVACCVLDLAQHAPSAPFCFPK